MDRWKMRGAQESSDLANRIFGEAFGNHASYDHVSVFVELLPVIFRDPFAKRRDRDQQRWFQAGRGYSRHNTE
jgi:hypothetical protein